MQLTNCRPSRLPAFRFRSTGFLSLALLIALAGGLLVERVAAVDKAAPKANAAKAPAKEAAPDDPVKEEFRAAKREIQTRLRNKQVFERITALRSAGKYPTLDAAKLVVTVGLKDDAPEVRSAAYDTLLDFKDNDEIARYLLTTVSKETRRGSVGPNTLPMLAVLLASTLPDVEKNVNAYLEKQANSHDGLEIIEALADELGGRGQSEDVASLTKLTALSTFEREFGLRRAVVQALIKINSATAIGQLIKILENVKGEIRGDIVQYLATATGQELGLDSAAWTDWWKENEKTFQAGGAV
ncbi:MAG TPA: hypothetical protein VGN12_20185, partial [Pirellulales bacterium]